MKGVVWTRGCSFSFGEGLQYFSNLPSATIPTTHEFDYFELRHSQYRFIQNNRYSKLLADMVGTIDVNSSSNGGSNNGIYNTLLELYNTKNVAKEDRLAYLDERFVPLCDVDIIVIQFTNIYRDTLIINGKVYPQINIVTSIDEYVEKFLKGNLTFDEYTKLICEQTITKFKELSKKIEAKQPNIKIRVFSWENELDEYLRNDEYFKDKTIIFNYKDKEYKTLRDIIYSNSKLTIEETFYPKCKNDQHMNLEGHRLIAESIYKTLI
jgi:hypothetical protein